jgi:hypothetical protein
MLGAFGAPRIKAAVLIGIFLQHFLLSLVAIPDRTWLYARRWLLKRLDGS